MNISNKDIIKQLRIFSITSINPIVINSIIKLIKIRLCSRPILIEFYSLGDLLKGCLILEVMVKLFPNLQIYLNITEEYNDYEDIFEEIIKKYSCLKSTVLPANIFRIAVFDTKVLAYNDKLKHFDYIFPSYFLAPLHISNNNFVNNKLRKLFEILPNEKVLTIGCFTSTDIETSNIKNKQIQQDLIQTNQVRYIPIKNLIYLLETNINLNIFDRIFLVPRNITEEQKTFNKLKQFGYISLFSKKIDSKLSSVVILPFKGILRGVYSMSNVSLVMGYHNVLEPYFCNKSTNVFCLKPPRQAPNYFLYNCGEKLMLLNSLSMFPDNYQEIENLLFSMSLSKINNSKEMSYFDDVLYQSSLKKVACNFNKFIDKI